MGCNQISVCRSEIRIGTWVWLTSTAGTVSELWVRRRWGWGQAGRPDWGMWWLNGLAEVNPEPTGTEKLKQSDVPLRFRYTWLKDRLAVSLHWNFATDCILFKIWNLSLLHTSSGLCGLWTNGHRVINRSLAHMDLTDQNVVSVAVSVLHYSTRLQQKRLTTAMN